MYDIELVVIERKQSAGGVISASRVRELIARQEFSQLEEYVPATTLAYLKSAAADPIRKQLQQ